MNNSANTRPDVIAVYSTPDTKPPSRTTTPNPKISLPVTPVQTTLTQLFGRNVDSPIELSSEEQSDDDFEPKPKRRNFCIATIPQVGDIVMSTATELRHPRLLFGEIDPGYIFFGLVKNDDKDTVDVAWLPVEIGHARVNVARKKGEPQDKFRSIVTVSRRLVRVVVKFNQQSLEKLNNFLKAAVYSEFFYSRKVGWKRIRRHD